MSWHRQPTASSKAGVHPHTGSSTQPPKFSTGAQGCLPSRFVSAVSSPIPLLTSCRGRGAKRKRREAETVGFRVPTALTLLFSLYQDMARQPYNPAPCSTINATAWIAALSSQAVANSDSPPRNTSQNRVELTAQMFATAHAHQQIAPIDNQIELQIYTY